MHQRIYLTIILIFVLLIPINNTRAETDSAPSGWPDIFRSAPESNGKYVVFTFDDAPMPSTGRLLQILDDHNIKATFFVEGQFAEWHPDLLVQIVEQGHEIGNHSYDHPDLTTLDSSEVEFQLSQTNRIICDLTGVTPHLFRPPGGQYNADVIDIGVNSGMTTVLWTANSADYLNPSANQLISKVLSRTAPGGIILLHDGVEVTLEVLPELIAILSDRGYIFITVGEMIEMLYGPCQWADLEPASASDISHFPVF